MVLEWRRAFCTSIPPDRDPTATDKTPTPRFGIKFGFFSNLSTPRFQSQPVSSPSLRCRTITTATVPAPSLPESPKLQCKTNSSPRFIHRLNPSSPRSPSTLSLLKSSLGLSKIRCGICLECVKRGKGMAIFTAECSHSFHFSCISAHVTKQESLTCPVCNSIWKDMPPLSVRNNQKPVVVEEKNREDVKLQNETKQYSRRSDLKVYNDDEPLMSPTSLARFKFNPIPESDENGDEDEGNGEFQGFFVNASTNPIFESEIMNSRNVEVSLLPEAAKVSVSRSCETYAIVLKVKAPPLPAAVASRAPIDLVAVIDVSGSIGREKLEMIRRAMRLVVSSLSSVDRLSIVAFSASSKRLLPLRRMTENGRRSARRIVDALAALEGTSSASDALKKAAKVLEDRREKNPIATIILLSNGDERTSTTKSSFVLSTRYAHQEIPVHSFGSGAYGHAASAFAKCVESLLSIVVQDLRIQLGFASGSAPAEIVAVYSYTGRSLYLESGSIRLGDLYAEEERELLIELKVPSSAIGAHHVLSVGSSYRDPSTQEIIFSKEQVLLVPRPHAVRSSAPRIIRLRNLFVTTRALAECRRLIDRNDLTGASRMISSARSLLLQLSTAAADGVVAGLEAELSELQRKCENQSQQIRRCRGHLMDRAVCYVDEKGEPLTPTSAWRAAEKLAKVAMMRKSLNRVSDLHGFEDARF